MRFLTDSTGAITDTYDYDAFGNLISRTGATPNNYLFAGEQFDPALGVYYNRDRYYDQRQGRFWTMDKFEGDPDSPASLHRYLYASNNPINRRDPSGNDDLAEVSVSIGIQSTLSGLSTIALRSVLGALGGAAFGAITAVLGGGDLKKSVLEGAFLEPFLVQSPAQRGPIVQEGLSSL